MPYIFNRLGVILRKPSQSFLKTQVYKTLPKFSVQHEKSTQRSLLCLKHKLPDIIDDAYGDAVIAAERETGLERSVFPSACPLGS